jgi:hypothetical protein
MTATTFDWSNARKTRAWGRIDARKFTDEVSSRNQPAVLKGQVSDWPAVVAGRETPEAFCDYLRGFDAHKPVNAYFGAPEFGGRYFYNEDLCSFNFQRRECGFDEFLDLLLRHLEDEHPPSFFTGALQVPVNLPRLSEHNYHHMFDRSMDQLVSLWLGNRTRTAAHYDLAQNIACVIRGRRRFILMPIEQLPNLYMGPIDVTPAGQAISLVDFLEPDFERHPRFRDAIEHAQVADLEPGDALYIPSMWYHHVETLTPLGAMMNFWWRDGPAYMFTPILTLLHSLLSIREMPAREREAWRVVFDHYVFQSGGDPIAHLPEEARGVLGEMTPERVSQLRQTLARSLLGK